MLGLTSRRLNETTFMQETNFQTVKLSLLVLQKFSRLALTSIATESLITRNLHSHLESIRRVKNILILKGSQSKKLTKSKTLDFSKGQAIQSLIIKPQISQISLTSVTNLKIQNSKDPIPNLIPPLPLI